MSNWLIDNTIFNILRDENTSYYSLIREVSDLLNIETVECKRRIRELHEDYELVLDKDLLFSMYGEE